MIEAGFVQGHHARIVCRGVGSASGGLKLEIGGSENSTNEQESHVHNSEDSSNGNGIGVERGATVAGEGADAGGVEDVSHGHEVVFKEYERQVCVYGAEVVAAAIWW